MDILNALKQLRDDLKTWVTNNLNALNAKIDEKTIPIDSELSATSTNPVQNKTITNAINNIPRFSGDYNDLTNAPNISEDDSGNMVIVDESGNIIFKADADGIHTTAVSLNGETAASEKYVDEAIANIDIPKVDFTGYATENFVNTAIDSAKEELSESIVSESSEWKIVDEAGNIIFSVDNTGAHTINLTLNGEEAATEAYVNEAIANIDIPEADLSNYYTKEQTDEAIKTANIPDSDWNASEGEPGHILNRTHWIEHVYSTVMPEETREVNEEIGAATFMADLVIGKTYRVKWNGSFHICTANAYAEVGILGGDDYPFVIDFFEGALDAYPNDDSTTVIIAIDEVTEIVHKIPAKFLPASAEETDPTVPAWAKTENKPTYTAAEVGALPESTPLFSGDYNDLTNAPNISSEENDDSLIITDDNGNIILRADVDGLEVTELIINGENLKDLINFEQGNSDYQTKITGTPGQFVVIGNDGNVTTKTISYAEEAIF